MIEGIRGTTDARWGIRLGLVDAGGIEGGSGSIDSSSESSKDSGGSSAGSRSGGVDERAASAHASSGGGTEELRVNFGRELTGAPGELTTTGGPG